MTEASKLLVNATFMFAFLSTSSWAQAETYRLMQANGNAEKEVARGLSKQECEQKKSELKTIARIFGAGSVTCLPESLLQG